MNNIKIVTYADAGMHDLLELSVRNKTRYAARHGYALTVGYRTLDTSRPAVWSKLLYLRRELLAADWLFWTDADSLVLDFDRPLDSFLKPDVDFITDADTNGLKAGEFFLRSCPAAIRFLDAVWDNAAFVGQKGEEQTAMADVLARDPEILRHAALGRQVISAYPHDELKHPFILHFVSNWKVLMRALATSVER